MNGLVDQPAFVGLELEGYNASVSLISFRVDQAVTAPYKFSSKYDPTKRNFSAIEPMKEMYFLTSELRYVSFVNDALVTACGLKPPKGYLVKYDPKAKKVPVSFRFVPGGHRLQFFWRQGVCVVRVREALVRQRGCEASQEFHRVC